MRFTICDLLWGMQFLNTNSAFETWHGSTGGSHALARSIGLVIYDRDLNHALNQIVVHRATRLPMTQNYISGK